MKQRSCIKADAFDLSMCGKFNQLNRRYKSKQRRTENRKEIDKCLNQN